ncbi:cobalt-precorrin-5B (C(1))-methyltransferase [Motiliproteus coralliicola]|uniref:Cobalt-precorrin-5B C(1)-methyltransferase n=1 Tax=Motiliproteus coralliicola TaxID=2283196 RepID=A0A369W9C2_9GAMM|nr:cobalt-precorrin-5B (C(1))-methyltransferase [Motiliproteus coralliicola]RDE18257.1 cobalt-precorrin-5B (C(1))-methyltransferase [Motiliproteus coralliicola]
MWPESSESPQPLRSGLTTGSCATACCVAAAQALLAGRQPQRVEISLPRGQQVELSIEGYQPLDGHPDKAFRAIRTATIKDAGDDPDVTHGATVYVELRLTDEPGVKFKPAAGVGTVTRTGLVLPVGEPAINPVPRQMMSEHLLRAADVYGFDGGFEVSVGVEQGEQIALKTMNPRLGIVGGLSILGTTGIVRPYSCAAYIASIRQGVDVARSNGLDHLAATTGSSSERAIRNHYGLTEMALIEMGDFVGALLKHLNKAPVARLSLCGGFGKIGKLANGHLDLNSRASAVDFEQLARLALRAGADEALVGQVKSANTSIEALNLCLQANIDLATEVCTDALNQAQAVLAKRQPQLALEVWAIDRKGHFVGHARSDNWQAGQKN